MNTPLALGVDVGGTNIRLAVVDPEGNISGRTQRNACLSGHDASDPAAAAELVLDMLEQSIAPVLAGHDGIAGVGIGFPGFFDAQQGLLLSSPNIPGLSNFPLAAELAERLAIPVLACNDAALAALGEFRFGIGRGASSLLHLTLGTGIGGGAIINNRPYTGDGGMALEVGHLHVAPEDRICGCGSLGCMESWASATAVAERFNEASGMAADAREVARLADAGDAQATAVLHDAGRILGLGIAEIGKLLDIRLVSISGGLIGAWKHFAPAMQHEIDARLLPPQVGRFVVQRSRLGDDAGILGAAASVFTHN